MSDLDDEEYTFTLHLRILSRRELRRAALEQAMEDGLTGHDWRRMRRSNPVANDLIMLLDPGSLAGCDIHESTAEAV